MTRPKFGPTKVFFWAKLRKERLPASVKGAHARVRILSATLLISEILAADISKYAAHAIRKDRDNGKYATHANSNGVR